MPHIVTGPVTLEQLLCCPAWSPALLRNQGFCWFLTQAFQEPIDSTLLPTGKCFQVLLSPYLKQTCRKTGISSFYFVSL